jgi:hypothetical protein
MTDQFNFSTGLEGLGGSQSLTPYDPYRIDNRVYKNERLNIDGYRFTNCAFINCTVITMNGNFEINQCYFQASLVYFGGNAQRIMKIAGAFATEWSMPEGLRPQRESDGAVTVK